MREDGVWGMYYKCILSVVYTFYTCCCDYGAWIGKGGMCLLIWLFDLISFLYSVIIRAVNCFWSCRTMRNTSLALEFWNESVYFGGIFAFIVRRIASRRGSHHQTRLHQVSNQRIILPQFKLLKSSWSIMQFQSPHYPMRSTKHHDPPTSNTTCKHRIPGAYSLSSRIIPQLLPNSIGDRSIDPTLGRYKNPNSDHRGF